MNARRCEMNLLIADDEELIRRGMLSLDWKSIGIDEVYSAANGYEAENLLNTEKLDIVIFDIRMPGFTGLDLSRMIKEKSMDTAVILLTGFSEFQYAQEAIRYGVYEYMLKPLRPKDILETVNRVKIRLEQERYKNKVVRQYESQSGSFDLLSQVMNAFPKTKPHYPEKEKSLQKKRIILIRKIASQRKRKKKTNWANPLKERIRTGYRLLRKIKKNRLMKI